MPDRQPKSARALIKDQKAFEEALRRAYLTPFLTDMQRRLATVTALNQVYAALQAGVAVQIAKPNAGIPTQLIVEALNRVRDHNRERVFKAFRRALGVDVRPLLTDVAVQPYMREKTVESIDRIRTIPRRFQDAMRAQVIEAFEDAPFDEQRLQGIFRDQFKSSGYNLRRIVRTTASQLNGELSQLRQQQLGITHFTWLSSRDQRVRPEHRLRDGRMYAWASPPDGEIPGSPIMCRCTAQAVVTQADRERLKANARPV